MRKKLVAGIAILALLFCIATGEAGIGGGSDHADSSDLSQNMPVTVESSQGEESEDTGESSKQNHELAGASTTEDQGSVSATAGEAKDTLTATFLDVGQGDCCVIRCGGKVMMVDGGPPKASSKVYAWLKAQEITHIDYLVATHADTDHVGGLSAALEASSCGKAYCSVKSASQDAFKDMKKRLESQGVSLKVPKVGSSWKLGSAKVKVIGGGGSGNDGSLILQVSHGSVALVLAGDATAASEVAAATHVSECDLLKVAHHGSASSSSYRFLRACMPKTAVISVGKDNTYGHPTEETLSRLRDCGAKVYRTDMQGDITATSNGKKLKVKVARNANEDTLKELTPATSSTVNSVTSGYIGNKNSYKFHKPSCRTLPEEKNRIYFKTRAKAIAAGYSPCGNCQP